MNETAQKFLYYIGIPVSVLLIFIVVLYVQFKDFEKAINIASITVQTLAIFIGGLGAYNKFAWDKKAESAIQTKALLMEYREQHLMAAVQYRADQRNDEKNAYMKYTMAMMQPRNHVVGQIHLSCYLPKNIRQKIFDSIWLTVGNAHGNNQVHLDENWKKFEIENEEIIKKLEDIVSW